MKTERIFSSRNDARVQKFSFWLERSIMKTLPVLCFSSVIEETVYITGSDETNFCDTDKIQRDERCTGREKEKKTGSRNKRCFSFFFSFFILQLASRTVVRISRMEQTFERSPRFRCRYLLHMERDLQNTRAAITSRRSFNPLPPPPPSVSSLSRRTCRILYDFSLEKYISATFPFLRLPSIVVHA